MCLFVNYRFIRLHYSHMFRVDTLTTPPKAAPGSGEERWISSSTLRDQDGEDSRSNPGTWSPVNVLRTPIIPATPDQISGNRRSPTPHFLREQSPGASSPLTPLHFIRRASVEPGLAPNPPSMRERSPGLSSDGGGSTTGSAPGKRPRVSATGTPVRQAQSQGTPGTLPRRWR